MLLTRIVLGLFLLQTQPLSTTDLTPEGEEPQLLSESANDPALMFFEQHTDAEAEIPGTSSSPQEAFPEPPQEIVEEAPRLSPLSYRDLSLVSLNPRIRVQEETREREPRQPPPPTSSRYPYLTTTTVHFAESVDKKPYTVVSHTTQEGCMAPCALEVPATKNKFFFQTEDAFFARKFNLSGPEQTLQLERDGNSGMVVGGALLLSLGIIADISGTIRFIVVDDKEDRLWTAGVTAFLTGILVASGITLITLGKPKVRKTYTVPDVPAETDFLDTVEFSVFPIREGLSAGAGFRF